MKKILFLFAIILIFNSCSKDKKTTPTPTLDVTGTWVGYSDSNDFYTISSFTSDQHPCVANNVVIFNADFTYTAKYNGTSRCAVAGKTVLGSDGEEIFGDPSNPVLTGSWQITGNDISAGNQHYTISTVNNRMALTYNSTVIFDGKTYNTSSVYYKK